VLSDRGLYVRLITIFGGGLPNVVCLTESDREASTTKGTRLWPNRGCRAMGDKNPAKFLIKI
jgi:hypothetical protein